MKLAHYVAQRLAGYVGHVFCISGSASLHLIHAIADTPCIDYVCPQHEQAAGFAADAYARLNGLGCALATSGPGATNLLTAIAASWADSVPVLYLTGNVATTQMKGDTGVRQMGFQETDIVSMARPVTKFAAQVLDPELIGLVLDQAIYYATSGRPGPVLIDIPDDMQRADIDPEALARWQTVPPPRINLDLELIQTRLRQAQRPLLIIGNGMRSRLTETAYFIRRTGIPYVSTWAALDLTANQDAPQFIGAFGTHAHRAANRAVQHADVILSLGARLDTKATGADAARFAPDAELFMVDIDPAEIAKMITRGRRVIGTCADAGDVAVELIAAPGRNHVLDIDPWRAQLAQWKAEDRAEPAPEHWTGDPYHLIEHLGRHIPPGSIMTADTGYTICWLAQAFPFSSHRLLHAFGNTPMGYGLPAAIGAAFAEPRREIYCITGDGSFQMSSAELATIARHNLPIKIILLNNGGHAMCRQTQDRWLGGAHHATSIAGGLGFPDFVGLAHANGIPANRMQIDTLAGKPMKPWVPEHLDNWMRIEGPALLEVEINPNAGLRHQVPYGKPLDYLEE